MKTQRERLITGLLLSYVLWVNYQITSVNGNKTVSKCDKLAGEREKNECHAQHFLKLVKKGRLADAEKKLDNKFINSNYLLGYKERVGMNKGFTALLWAAQKNNTDMVNFLVERGSIVSQSSASGFTALYYMAQYGNLEGLEILLGKGAEVDTPVLFNGYTPVLIATDMGYTSIVKALLAEGADPNVKSKKTGITPILLAAEDGNTDIVKILLNNGADPNTKSETRGFFPLYFAAKMGNTEMVRLLLEAEADVDSQNLNGETALIAATAWNREAIVDSLLAYSADANIVDNLKTGALHRAAYYGYTYILKELIRKKAEINAKNDEERTPLHFSAKGAQTSTLEELLKNCPNDRIRDMNGETALELARREEEIMVNKTIKTARTLRMIEGFLTYIPRLSRYTNKACSRNGNNA